MHLTRHAETLAAEKINELMSDLVSQAEDATW
jgi:hypothetical protein